MTIIEGQIQPLKELKETLSRRGITRFNSVGDINRFLRDFTAEKNSLYSFIEQQLEEETKDLQSSLHDQQESYAELLIIAQSQIRQEIEDLESQIQKTNERIDRNFLCKLLFFLRAKSLVNKRINLETNLDNIAMSRTREAFESLSETQKKVEALLADRDKILSRRYAQAVSNLDNTKQVIDSLYPLIAGAVGESAVVKSLQQLSDDYYLINDFSAKFNPPIFQKKERDKIFSVQADHLLICRAGVFLLETKNWSRASVENLDLRSPVKQIMRTSFALFVLLNSDSSPNTLKLKHHHWGDQKIAIRNIIVMTNERPREEFKHVKILSLDDLVGYIKYFEETLSAGEVRRIFEYLKQW